MKGGKWNQLMSYNNDLILFLSFSAFTYRNVWPLMTYTGTPTDSVEGSMLWIEGALLMLVSVGYMLFVPRPYIPVDEEVCLENVSTVLSYSFSNFASSIPPSSLILSRLRLYLQEPFIPTWTRL